jgi:alkanesulfonate monooxygenase SsuD/methylene tetrahydromethanopterin reductase-like flavin-dependent oxidoreductase (luciferase family)
MSLGVVFLPSSPPEQLVAVARAADEAGLPELWLWEDCFKESGIASAAAALASTQQLRVGIGLLPVPLRNVALTAMEIATIERLFPGRLVPGVGHGVQDWMAQVGAKPGSPLTLLREYGDALQRLLSGESVTTQGRYVALDRVQLDWPPAPAPLVFGGATGPKTLALCGEVFGGTILTGGTTPAQVREARSIVDEATSRSGRTGHHQIVTFLIAATGPDAVARKSNTQQQWDLDLAQDNAVAGDAEEVAAAVRRLTEAGADSVILQPTDDEPDMAAFAAFVAHDVAAQLDGASR